MRISGRVDVRAAIFALLAVAFGGWALVALAPLGMGMPQRPGPGTVPYIVAVGLVVMGAAMLVRAATGIASSPPRPLRWPWRLALLPPLILLVLLPEIVVFFGDVAAIAAIGNELRELAIRLGPSEFLALIWFRWALAIALGVIAAGEGALSGVVSLLAGALIGLAGTDVASGEDRLPQLEMLLETFPFGVEIGVVVLTLVCRVNPLPAILAFAGAASAEEMFRRAMMLTRGEPLQALGGRPTALAILVIITLIAVALAWYRWPWRGPDAGPADLPNR